MRKLNVKLTAFDLLHWINDRTVSTDLFEQAVVRNTIINLLDLYDHWCKDAAVCDVCRRPEASFVRNAEHELFDFPKRVDESNRKLAQLSSRLIGMGFDISALFSGFMSPESHTVLRATAYQGLITDYGEMIYTRRAAMSVLGSNNPVVVQSESFGKTGFDDILNLTVFIDASNGDDDWDNENALAANELVEFTKLSLRSTQIGDIEIPTSIERVETEVLALGGVLEDERDLVSVERHKVANVTKSHPVLGRIANGNDTWAVISYGTGRTINEAMRAILDSNGDPAITTDEAVKLASIVFSKRGTKQTV